MKIDELRRRLTAADQQHVLAFWDELSESRRAALAETLAQIDFEQLARLVADNQAGPNWKELARRAESPPAVRLDGSGSPVDARTATQMGAEALASGEVAALLVAGGQGTRLGYDHPKGLFPLGPVSGRSLFALLIDKLSAAAERNKATIPLYIMTSPATHDETAEFFAAHDNLGLSQRDLRLFCQGTMPAVDAATGKLLMARKSELALSPDGHGGVVAALARSGMLDEMCERGVRRVFYFQVDNPLVPMCDPAILGYHLAARSEMSTLVISKNDPLERVGNVVSIDRRVQIIEYSDLPKQDALRRDADGGLTLWAGNTAVHVIDVDFLSRCADQADALPFHRANKSVSYLDANGRLIEPDEKNAIKFERFVFDLLPLAESSLVVEVDRRTAFAPVKEADDVDKVRQQMIDLDRARVRAAGGDVADGIDVEIHPRLAADPEALRSQLPPDGRVTAPRYFC